MELFCIHGVRKREGGHSESQVPFRRTFLSVVKLDSSGRRICGCTKKILCATIGLYPVFAVKRTGPLSARKVKEMVVFMWWSLCSKTVAYLQVTN